MNVRADAFCSTIDDPKVYRFDTKVDIVPPTKHCSTDPVISAFMSSHQHRLSSFVSALCSAVYFRVRDGTKEKEEIYSRQPVHLKSFQYDLENRAPPTLVQSVHSPLSL